MSGAARRHRAGGTSAPHRSPRPGPPGPSPGRRRASARNDRTSAPRRGQPSEPLRVRAWARCGATPPRRARRCPRPAAGRRWWARKRARRDRTARAARAGSLPPHHLAHRRRTRAASLPRVHRRRPAGTAPSGRRSRPASRRRRRPCGRSGSRPACWRRCTPPRRRGRSVRATGFARGGRRRTPSRRRGRTGRCRAGGSCRCLRPRWPTPRCRGGSLRCGR